MEVESIEYLQSHGSTKTCNREKVLYSDLTELGCKTPT